MINQLVPQASVVGQPARIWRPGGALLWPLLIAEGLLLALALTLVLGALPRQLPLSQIGQAERVRSAILSGDLDDPLVEVRPGLEVRASNMRGLRLGGETYYYYFEGKRGFDPLSRGAVSQGDVEVLLRDDGGPTPLVVYRMLER